MGRHRKAGAGRPLDHKTIADFHKDHGRAIQQACAQFVSLCRELGLFSKAIVALDGSKFKAVNSRDNNFTVNKVAKRLEQAEIHVARYLTALERADRQGGKIAEEKTPRLTWAKDWRPRPAGKSRSPDTCWYFCWYNCSDSSLCLCIKS